MKKLKRLLSIICGLFIVFTITSCDPKTTFTTEKTPIWQVSDTEYEKSLGQKDNFIRYTLTHQQRPLFYQGPMPLQVKSIKRKIISGETQTIFEDFGDFINYFIYDQNPFIIIGAMTFDLNDNLLAEIRLNRVIKEGNKIVEAEEFHYKDGQLIFTCKSEFNLSLGDKLSEKDIVGKKIKDYYFVLPQ